MFSDGRDEFNVFLISIVNSLKIWIGLINLLNLLKMASGLSQISTVKQLEALFTIPGLDLNYVVVSSQWLLQM